jgi:serine protease AprX
VSNRAALHIGVMNLSLGEDPTQSTFTAPLNSAVEAAWRAGVVVVTSAGNYGPDNGTISKPGDDPLVITAGALDDGGQTNPSGFSIPAFSSVGPTYADGWFKPDLVADGRSVVSVRAPGSTVDVQNPSAEIGAANFVGSGTSFSAAITSGAAALVLQAHPSIQPNEVKGRLLANTRPGPVGNPFVDGHGLLAADLAIASKPISVTVPSLPARVLSAILPITSPEGGPTPSVPLPLDWWYSTWNVGNWSPGPSLLSGLLSGLLPSLSGWNGSGWNGSGWNGSGWNGSTWNGSGWNGSGWNGSGWNGSGWNGSGWNGSGWNVMTWSGSGWNGSGWNGSAWNGSGWNGSGWNGSGWNGSGWNVSGWNGSGWN